MVEKPQPRRGARQFWKGEGRGEPSVPGGGQSGWELPPLPHQPLPLPSQCSSPCPLPCTWADCPGNTQQPSSTCTGVRKDPKRAPSTRSTAKPRWQRYRLGYRTQLILENGCEPLKSCIEGTRQSFGGRDSDLGTEVVTKAKALERLKTCEGTHACLHSHSSTWSIMTRSPMAV